MKPQAMALCALLAWWYVYTGGPAVGRYAGPFNDEVGCETFRATMPKAKYPTSWCWEGPKPKKDSDDEQFED